MTIQDQVAAYLHGLDGDNKDEYYQTPRDLAANVLNDFLINQLDCPRYTVRIVRTHGKNTRTVSEWPFALLEYAKAYYVDRIEEWKTLPHDKIVATVESPEAEQLYRWESGA